MRTKSAWSRGLLYAACSGILVLLAVVVAASINGQGVASAAAAGAVSFIAWGGVGFLIGFFGHGEVARESSAEPAPETTLAKIRRWVYRVIAGLALGHLAAAAVEGLMLTFVIVMYGGLDEFLKQRPRLPHELRFEFIGLSVMIGSTVAAMLAGFLGVVLAPLRYDSRWLIRSSAMAAALGALAGAWVGGLAGILYPQFLESGPVMIAAILFGAVAGIAAAVVLRVRVNR